MCGWMLCGGEGVIYVIVSEVKITGPVIAEKESDVRL
jgi:hypothetical protein